MLVRVKLEWTKLQNLLTYDWILSAAEGSELAFVASWKMKRNFICQTSAFKPRMLNFGCGWGKSIDVLRNSTSTPVNRNVSLV